MKIKHFSISILFVIFYSAFCAAQTDSSYALSGAPMIIITNIQAVQNQNTVTLTWTNPKEHISALHVYRHTEPISQKNYDLCELIAKLPAKTSEYIDALPEARQYFYAVLAAVDTAEHTYLVAPFNTTIAGVTGVETGKKPQSTQITALQAIVKEQTAIITYASTIKNKRITLYRSTSPFINTASLTNAVLVETFTDKGAPYIDYPIPEVPYYYALVDEESFKSGEIFFIKDKNTTAIPITVSITDDVIRQKAVSTVRPIPLPYLAQPPEKSVKNAYVLSVETRAIVDSLSKGVKPLPSPVLQPYIFPQDRKTATAGEEYTLHLILNGTFDEKNWDKAVSDLRKFLSIRRTEETTSRAYFYLGEALYFSGSYTDALFNFLLAQNTYFAESQKWVQNVLQRISD